jgi:hypothetical protein
VDLAASLRCLKGSFGTGESAADDLDLLTHAALSPSPSIRVKVFKTKLLGLDPTCKVLISGTQAVQSIPSMELTREIAG